MAIIINDYCPRCGGLRNRKEGIIEDVAVLGCKSCKLFWLEGDDVACVDVNALKVRLEAIQRWRDMMESDIDDPRCTRLA